MIHELDKASREKARPLFQERGHNQIFIDALFEGNHTGRIFVDNRVHPSTALAALACDFFCPAGRTDNLAFNSAIRERILTELVPPEGDLLLFPPRQHGKVHWTSYLPVSGCYTSRGKPSLSFPSDSKRNARVGRCVFLKAILSSATTTTSPKVLAWTHSGAASIIFYGMALVLPSCGGRKSSAGATRCWSAMVKRRSVSKLRNHTGAGVLPHWQPAHSLNTALSTRCVQPGRAGTTTFHLKSWHRNSVSITRLRYRQFIQK